MKEGLPGHYLGTEIDGKWWRRYRRDRMFARGNGTWRQDATALHFKRFFLKSFAIPFAAVTDVQLGKWHAGRWAAGYPVIKLIWRKDGLCLGSGFVLTRSLDEAEALRKVFLDLIANED